MIQVTPQLRQKLGDNWEYTVKYMADVAKMNRPQKSMMHESRLSASFADGSAGAIVAILKHKQNLVYVGTGDQLPDYGKSNEKRTANLERHAWEQLKS